MWCPSCGAEVTVEWEALHKQALCPGCQMPLASLVALASAPSPPPQQPGDSSVAPVPESRLSPELERTARELLRRWSSQTAIPAEVSVSPFIRFDRPFQSPRRPVSLTQGASSPVASSLQPSSPEKGAVPEAVPVPSPSTSARAARARRRAGRTRLHRSMSPERASSREQQTRELPIRPLNWTAVAGHLLAYLGVVVLTCGSALAIWSYYTNTPSWGPMGWLVVTVGQMLLFLGVISLVSSGLEQTVESVSQKVDEGRTRRKAPRKADTVSSRR